MEESKELQGFYKIFRAVIYVSILMEFFAYALEPEQGQKPDPDPSDTIPKEGVDGLYYIKRIPNKEKND